MQKQPLYTTADLLERIANGDEGAFRLLFDQYSARFYALARRMSNSPDVADEMVQEIFLKIWVNRATLPSINNPESYFFTILYRQLFKHFKKLALERKLLRLIAESPSFQEITDETILLQESERLVNEAVAKLPTQQQLVFRLSKQDGLSREQIAAELKISPNTVRNHLADAMKSIRIYLQRAAIVYFLFYFSHSR